MIEGSVGRKRRDEVSDGTVFDPKPFSYQMCLNSDDFADTFQTTLHSVTFFFKSVEANCRFCKKNCPYYVKRLSFYFVVTILDKDLVMQESSACCAARAREFQ